MSSASTAVPVNIQSDRRGALSARALSCVIAGALLALSYPPFPLGFLVYPALGLALWTAGLGRNRPISWKTAARRGWLIGFVWHLGTLYWVVWVAPPGMLVMAAILGLYVAVVFGLCALFETRFGPRAIWLFPVVWVGHEYLRGLGELAFPWTNLSLSQVTYVYMIQHADIAGDLFVGFTVALTSVLMLRLFLRWTARRQGNVRFHVLSLILALVLPYLYGHGAVDRLESVESIRIAVLQGDIDSFQKWEDGAVDHSFAVYETLTRAAADSGAALIVWPETAAPLYLRSSPEHRIAIRRLSAELSVPILLGTLEYERLSPQQYLRYNAAVYVRDGAYDSAYHAKLQLVPFGEWIPFSNRWHVLDNLDVGGAHFTAGTTYWLFEHEHGPFAAAICFESAFPAIIRRFAANGARFLVNITNDGWYGFTSGPTQHADIAVFRAIENRRPIARSANTGISCFIDRAGRIRDASAQYVPDVRIFDLPLGRPDETTFFLRHGMFFGQGCAAAAAALALIAALLSRPWRTTPPAHSV